MFRTDPEALLRAGVASGPIRMPPSAVAAPRDAEDLSDLVTWAVAEGVGLVPRGAGTGMPGGNVGPGVCVDLSAWTHVGPVDPESRTVTVGPGAIASTVEAQCRAHGLRFPPLPSSADRCTLGGMVANNAAGARTFRFGAVRDWVESVDVVFADGTHATLQRGDALLPSLDRAHTQVLRFLGGQALRWPDVRKNSSGYALDRFLPTRDPVELLVGSEGTLGLVTAARLRLTPVEAGSGLLLFALPSLDLLPAAIQVADEVEAAVCEFFAGRFLDVAGLREHARVGPVVGTAPALLLVEVEGSDDQVESALGRVIRFADDVGAPWVRATDAADRRDLWAVRHAASPVIAERARDGLVSMQFIEDSVVRPHHLPAYLAGLETILAEEETDAVMFGHAGDGNVHVNPLVDVGRADWRARVARILDSTVDLVAGLGGTLSGEHGDGRIRAPFHPRIFGSRVSEAFQAVKDALDPQGCLNPGVVVPLAGQDPLAGLSPAPRRR